jgi:hypothetical protein
MGLIPRSVLCSYNAAACIGTAGNVAFRWLHTVRCCSYRSYGVAQSCCVVLCGESRTKFLAPDLNPARYVL